MMSILLLLKRKLVWLKRIRHRKGYGVHSPFAFNLITQVIYETSPYYAYRRLREIRNDLLSRRKALAITERHISNQRVDELLFRLVNYVSPCTIIEIGTSHGLTTLYLSSAKKQVRCITVDKEQPENTIAQKLFEKTGANIEFHVDSSFLCLGEILKSVSLAGFILFTVNRNSLSTIRLLFEQCLNSTDCNSLIVIKGIHSCGRTARWWNEVISDNRTGVTFDLYDVGFVFFDKTKIKQHYIVNF